MTRVLFVCMGNICRSPTAEGVLRHVIVSERREAEIATDSAGTHDYHTGERPDPGAVRAAARKVVEGGGRFPEEFDALAALPGIGRRSRSRRMTSIPSMPGMTMSSVTASGRNWRYFSTACRPSLASPATSQPQAVRQSPIILRISNEDSVSSLFME